MTSGPPWFERLVSVVPTLAESPFSSLPAPADGSARQSAVLILFGPHDSGSGADLLLTERSPRLRAHAGQVAFPGGRLDPGESPAQAAVREAVEETGLDPAGVRVRAVGPDLYLPVSNFLVSPVIAWWEHPSPVAPVDEAEVARVVRVPVDELLDPANRFQTVHPSGFLSPGFQAGDLWVWGFTGGVLDWLLSLCGLERPWDREPPRPVPQRFMADLNTDLNTDLDAALATVPDDDRDRAPGDRLDEPVEGRVAE
jgi:8-oxo-dGTP pyrophosphatase MutT (NUDIX family)